MKVKVKVRVKVKVNLNVRVKVNVNVKVKGGGAGREGQTKTEQGSIGRTWRGRGGSPSGPKIQSRSAVPLPPKPPAESAGDLRRAKQLVTDTFEVKLTPLAH